MSASRWRALAACLFDVAALSLGLAILLSLSAPVLADEPKIVISTPGGPVEVPASVAAEAAKRGISLPGMAQPVPAQPPQGQDKDKQAKPDEKKDGDKDKKDAGKKESEEPKTVSRPTKPPEPPNPKELEAGPDDKGLFRFNFKGQPWPAVLEWLAKHSKMSLHWLEAPGGYVNLATRRSYTIEETRDLINCLLLDHGFTILCEGEVMSVVNLKKLNPSKVPRVAPDDLEKHQPYEFVKVSFPLRRLTATAAVEELTPYKSDNGRLTAMTETNRVEAMDAVINLRDIHALLLREENASGAVRPPWVKRLTHRRATEVVVYLERLLGVSKGPSGPMTPEQMQQQMQQMQQAAQQAQQKDGKPGSAKKPDAEVHLVADERNNAIIAYAPADKLAIIEKAVEIIDVPPQTDGTVQAMLTRTKPYHLSTMDPEPLIKILEESGNLEPDTRLTAYPGTKTILVSAGLVDHVRIGELIKQLDGSGRKGEVIQLRRLPADCVAGTIRQLFFGGGGTDQQKKKRSFSLYGSWDDYGSRFSSSERKDTDRFQVDADVETNRLLLWANEYEMKEVKEFLVKLGENPDDAENTETIRVLDAFDDAEMQKLLDQVRQMWPGQNRLLIAEPDAESPSSRPSTGKPAQSQPSPAEPAASPEQTTLRDARITFTQLRGAAPVENASAPSDPAPVMIRRNPDGRLVIASRDAEALDRLESLVARLTPTRARYKVFRLKNAWSVDVVDNLKKYFKDDMGPSLEDVYRAGWYGNRINVNDNDASVGLSRRRPLTFIPDSVSNTILVKDADPAQLKIISQLIEEYDRREPMDSDNVRQEGIFQIRYSKASAIAATIKDLYRDLLSTNDKEFDQKRNGQGRGESYSYVFRTFSSGEDEGKIERAPKFKGLLSLGVDDSSNTLLVSAPRFLYKNVAQMVLTLDEAARPAASTMSVVKLGDGVTAVGLRDAITKLNGETPPSDTSSRQQPRRQHNHDHEGRSQGPRPFFP